MWLIGAFASSKDCHPIPSRLLCGCCATLSQDGNELHLQHCSGGDLGHFPRCWEQNYLHPQLEPRSHSLLHLLWSGISNITQRSSKANNTKTVLYHCPILARTISSLVTGYSHLLGIQAMQMTQCRAEPAAMPNPASCGPISFTAVQWWAETSLIQH